MSSESILFICVAFIGAGCFYEGGAYIWVMIFCGLNMGLPFISACLVGVLIGDILGLLGVGLIGLSIRKAFFCNLLALV